MLRIRPDLPQPGFDVRQGDDTPGFRVDSDGPVRYAVDDAPGSAPPPTPVNCTVTGGDLSCTSSGGTSFYPAVPAPRGFPERLGPDNQTHHAYDVLSPPAAGIPAVKLMEGVISSPTPGPGYLNGPATVAGTPNEATPPFYYHLFLGGSRLPMKTPLSPVTSHVRTDQYGNPVVVNVTEPGHPLFPGYVIHSVVPSPEGPRIRTEGEGLGKWQAPDSPQWLRDELSQQTWGPYQQRIIDRVR